MTQPRNSLLISHVNAFADAVETVFVQTVTKLIEQIAAQSAGHITVIISILRWFDKQRAFIFADFAFCATPVDLIERC